MPPDQEFGSDGQVHPVAEPLAALAAAEANMTPTDPFEASEPASAAQRLRAFEDEHLGADAVRLHDRIERGSGSLFERLPDDKRNAHAMIEKTVETERKLNDARAAVATAEAEHDAAVAAAEDASRFGG